MAGRIVYGWVSGDTERQISVSDINWKRLGQFTARKVQLLQCSTGLLVKPHPGLSFLLSLRGRNDLFPPAPDLKKYRWGFQQEFFDESEP